MLPAPAASGTVVPCHHRVNITNSVPLHVPFPACLTLCVVAATVSHLPPNQQDKGAQGWWLDGGPSSLRAVSSDHS